MGKPRIFISHCESNFEPTDYAIRIVDAIGCVPVVAEKEPKLSRIVRSLAYDTLESCDAAVVIATPDSDSALGKSPSQGVLVEIGRIQSLDAFKGKYVIIQEESVVLSPMIPEARYKFKMGNYGPLAEAILVELGSMGLFRNYYEIPGSDMQIHELMDTLSQLKELREKGVLKQEHYKSTITDVVKRMVEQLIK